MWAAVARQFSNEQQGGGRAEAEAPTRLPHRSTNVSVGHTPQLFPREEVQAPMPLQPPKGPEEVTCM